MSAAGLQEVARTFGASQYSGILGIFPNQMLNDHGASGDGKSVVLWFITQAMHYLRKQILKNLKKDWQDKKDAYQKWVEEGKPPASAVPDPGQEPTWDKLCDAGSLIG